MRNPHLKKKKKIHVELWFKCADYVSFSWLSLNAFESAKKKTAVSLKVVPSSVV